MNGFIKIHRCLVNWEWYDDINTKVLWFHILLKANFKPTKWHGIELEAGQLITSYASLAKETRLSTQRVRTSIERLKSTGEITIKTTNKFTLVTVANWEKYQTRDVESAGKTTSTATNSQHADSVNKLLTTLDSLQKSTSKLTSKKEAETLISSTIEDIKKEISTSTATNEQQTNNKQITNNQQQRKNDKKDKKEYIPPLSPLEKTVEDFKEFRKSIKKPMTERAVVLLYSKLNRLAGDDEQKKIAILEQSIFHGWQGLFELKDDYVQQQAAPSQPKRYKIVLDADGKEVSVPVE